MTSRLDRLLILLDTGSSTSVRTTAAKQLAQLAAKSVRSDVSTSDDVTKLRVQSSYVDQSQWKELMSVVARVLPYLHSKSYETRTAASVAISQICSLVPLWEPSPPEEDHKPSAILRTPEFPAFSVKSLIESGRRLLASSGKEFAKPEGIFANAAEVQKARKAAMSRLGLDFLDNVGGADDMDWEKELVAPDTPVDTQSQSNGTPKEEDVKMELDSVEASARKDTATPEPRGQSTPPAQSVADENLAGLSARERNRLKRKRKPGNSAFVAPPPVNANSKFNTAPGLSGSKTRLVDSRSGSPKLRLDDSKQTNSDEKPDRVVVDPTKGGAIDPKASQQSKALEVVSGHWVWDGVVKLLEVDLFSDAWEIRHGAAMALRELLKVQGKCGGMRSGLSTEENQYTHEAWCNHLAANLLCIFVLDRFGDFVSDQVIAPVRETVSQTLASLLLHMPRRSVLHVHAILLQMIKQDFTITPCVNAPKSAMDRPRQTGGKSYIWEVRHAGLLGIKYEVAVRNDIVAEDVVKSEDEVGGSSRDVLRGIVDAAVLGLGDTDDDVRSVAASCLSPITAHLVNQLAQDVPTVLAVLWSCLRDMKDDLSSSVGAVMDLLGRLVSYDQVICILANPTSSEPLTVLAPTLFPFFRHTIPSVRLAVVKTLNSFLDVPTLSRDWITEPFLRLILQNLVVEERSDIREATLNIWNTALLILHENSVWLEQLATPQLVLEWYTLVMTPLGVPIDPSTLYHSSVSDNSGGISERHNVDKSMLSQDQSLVSMETILKARVAAATALAWLNAAWPSQGASLDEMFRPMLEHYIQSPSMLQKFLAAIIVEEWSHKYDNLAEGRLKNGGKEEILVDVSVLAKDLSEKILLWLQSDPPVAYHEMALSLSRIFSECSSLLHSFTVDCKVPREKIPSIGATIDILGQDENSFTIETAASVVGPIFTQLKDSLGRSKKKELASMQEKKIKIQSSIDRYKDVKAQHDVRVSAAFAAAFVSLKLSPGKVSPLVKGLMNGIKNEENIDLQTRSASAVASFIDFCTQNNVLQPPEKIVKNLCTFLCQDTEYTPTFAYSRKTESGVLTFRITMPSEPISNGKSSHGNPGDTKESDKAKARLCRRGAQIAFVQLNVKFGPRLFELIPKMWEYIAGGVLSTFVGGTAKKADQLMDKQTGQDVIDSLSILQVTASTLHQDLWSNLVELFPKLTLALQSRFAIIRQCTARCFASLCNVVTAPAMRFVIEHVVPLLGDAVTVFNRQGAIELIHHIVQQLDIKALPYVIFLVVPVLGRMSDLDDDTRSIATNTFASLVKMVPLEAGLPDPPDFSEELTQKREEERKFLTQLLDGSKVEQYSIPVPIKAELRKYQQDGVNWLAFLAKYQLHGILCDDMGLGKTLQSICILASKHYERAERYKATKSSDSVHLPSLIVCPPTLMGHWYYEIQKYAENLKPIMYGGSSRDRTRLLEKLSTYDVVITSYEIVRNDIQHLQALNWNFCILDEGHIIKNAKAKLTKSVKCIRANHRLILSGTPIQNNVLELWSLFDFLMPGFLGTEHFFSERYSKPILANRDGKSKNSEAAALALEALHKQVLPFLLRRLKEDVLNDLPPKIIQDYYCELSDLQKYLYDDFSKSQAHSAATGAIQNTQVSTNGGEQKHIFQSLQYLRKLCNHPLLVFKNDTQAIEMAFSSMRPPAEKADLHDIQHAPKLLALRQLLMDCGIGTSTSISSDVNKSEFVDSDESSSAFSQHRVLIFCQLKQMLDIIETDLFKRTMPSVTYMRLDGNTEANKRHAIVQTFNADPSIDCLLLTTHVGGLGLTLTGADTVIFVEHDWNPMKDLQAMDRAHRIGQKKVVNVYRLITKGTLEEKIMGLQRFKLNIANSVVTQQNAGLDTMETDTVLDLFRRTTEQEDEKSARKQKDNFGPTTQKHVLEGLDDLPAEEEYDSLNLSSFMASIGQ